MGKSSNSSSSSRAAAGFCCCVSLEVSVVELVAFVVGAADMVDMSCGIGWRKGRTWCKGEFGVCCYGTGGIR